MDICDDYMNMQHFVLKFQANPEKITKNSRELLFCRTRYSEK